MKLAARSLVLASLFVLFSARIAPAERAYGLINLSLKYVIYLDADGVPVSNQNAAIQNIKVMNHLWSQCAISFKLEQFAEVDPAQYGLNFHPSNLSEMDQIRAAFQDPSHLLIVTTGSWNRSGTLGESAANAWTAMPTSDPYGSVLEAPVATYSVIYSHEMGHYLNLDHAARAQDLMNPIIYTRSTQITPEECETARATAQSFWSHALRS